VETPYAVPDTCPRLDAGTYPEILRPEKNDVSRFLSGIPDLVKAIAYGPINPVNKLAKFRPKRFP